MKKIFILIIISITTFSTILARTHTNRTFLTPRSQLDNMAMEYTTWHTQIGQEKLKFGGSIQATGFFQKSTNKSNLGQYFGYYAEREDVIRDYISIIPAVDANSPTIDETDNIPSGYIVHNNNRDPETAFNGKTIFKPTQQVYGVRLDYHQTFFNDFFFKAAFPIVEVKNSVATIEQTFVQITEAGAIVVAKSLFDYFSGNLKNDQDAGDLQQALTHAKIAGQQSNSGIADINLALGYNIWNRRGNKIGISIIGTIPTGNEAKGEYLFEPIYGNSDHWALGGQVDSKFRLWNNTDDTLELLINFNLKYLFENTEKRTVGLKANNGKKLKFGHYYLAGVRNEFPLIPLANVLTQDVEVEPGLQFEGIAALAFNSNNVTFDVGYNIFAKEGESISLKNEWNETKYAIALPGYKDNEGYATTADGPFNPDDPTHYDTKTIPGPIETKHLDLESITSPTQFTHKLYCGLGYSFDQWKFPLMLGLGTSFEFINCNTGLENYAIWGKIGLSF